MPTQKNKICPDCGKKIWSDSIHCKSCSKKGKLNTFYGHKHSPKTIEKISGKNHFNWKGEKAKYGAIHIWVNSHKGKSEICKYCGKTNREVKMEWANKDHKYRRNLDDYIALCFGCHKKYDYKMGFRTYVPKQNPINGRFDLL